MSHTIELPDEVYEAIRQAASAGGTTVPELLRQEFGVARNGYNNHYVKKTNPWLNIEGHLKIIAVDFKPRFEWTEEEKDEARQRFSSLAGAIDSGLHNGANNESIDADLAQYYSSEMENSQ